ncbi:MAG: DUF1801 domain-containing protein [Flavobacteriaceae bacterium]|nr:DUF1801 domain-containing protein [Flavobacteriaceae bacterium]
MNVLNKEVTQFLDTQNHPLRDEIEHLRAIILKATDGLTENIKWNGPNYCFNEMDRITMRIQPPKQIQLIFHRGSKKMEQPKARIIASDSKLLSWKENDRAVITFKDLTAIENAKADLKAIINEWIEKTA